MADMSSKKAKALATATFWDRLDHILGGSIRTRLLLTMAVVVLLTAVIVSASSIYISFQNGRQQVIDQLEAEVTLKEASLNTWEHSLKIDLAMLLAQEDTQRRMRMILQPTAFYAAAFQKMLRNELVLNMGHMMELTHRYDELYLLNSDGEVVVATTPAREGRDYRLHDYFRNGLDRAKVHPLWFSTAEKKLQLIVTQPVFDENGQVVGVLVGRAAQARLDEILQKRTASDRSDNVYLVSLQRFLLTESPFPDYQPGRSMLVSEAVNNAVYHKINGVGFYQDFRKVPVVGVYRWLPELQVVFISEVDQAEALRPIYFALVINLGITIVAVLVALYLGGFITRTITHPLQQLTDTATQIAAGNLDIVARQPRVQEIGRLAGAFNHMTERLRSMVDTLEERVYQRTRALETSTAISSQMIAILDLNELLRYVVERIQIEFNFYHTHIYLLEEGSGDLVIAEGSGEVGRLLKEQGHRLKPGKGIVGYVASKNEPYLSNNVNVVPYFVRNPLLPNTVSELAVPLRKGNQVLGVLDIQSDQLHRFTHADMSLMQSIANQTAIAIDNVRLLAQMQSTVREVERLNRRLTGEVWQDFVKESPVNGYRFDRGAIRPVGPAEPVDTLPMQTAAEQKQLIVRSRPGNGQPSAVELAVPLILRGQVIGVLGVKRDRTEIWDEDELTAVEAVAGQISLALENARLTAEQGKTIVQLKDVDRLKSEFLTSMSHELRTPLNSIIGFADVLLQGIDGELNPVALNDIQLIYNSGQHLLALINDILDLSKIEAGKMELVREPLSVADAVNEVLAASSSLLQKKSLALTANVSRELPHILADRLRFNQIVLNLVSNAVKFTEQGGVIISAQIDPADPGKMRVEVADTGIGIPQNKINAIFDRFSQADSSTTRKYGGSGLGLTICKQLVEMHGGRIGICNQPQGGSMFYFTIPLAVEGDEDDLSDFLIN